MARQTASDTTLCGFLGFQDRSFRSQLSNLELWSLLPVGVCLGNVTLESTRSHAWSSAWPGPGTKLFQSTFCSSVLCEFRFLLFTLLLTAALLGCGDRARLPSNRDSDSHATANTAAATARSMLSRTIQEQREMRVNVPHRSGLRIPLARRMSKRPG